MNKRNYKSLTDKWKSTGFGNLPHPSEDERIAAAILEASKIPYEDLPLHIASDNPITKALSKMRLEKGWE